MMYTQLYQYLLANNRLPVPGIGTFLLEETPARIDVAAKLVYPPAWGIQFEPGGYLPGPQFFGWLAAALGIASREAVFRFNDFAIDLKKQISEGAVINWNGIGTLQKGLGGDLQFSPEATAKTLQLPVTAEKIIRVDAGHMVRVGEDQRTSADMKELLGKPAAEKKSASWSIALALLLLSVMFIGWYLSSHGLDISATRNTQSVSPGTAVSTYHYLP